MRCGEQYLNRSAAGQRHVRVLGQQVLFGVDTDDEMTSSERNIILQRLKSQAKPDYVCFYIVLITKLVISSFKRSILVFPANTTVKPLFSLVLL